MKNSVAWGGKKKLLMKAKERKSEEVKGKLKIKKENRKLRSMRVEMKLNEKEGGD